MVPNIFRILIAICISKRLSCIDRKDVFFAQYLNSNWLLFKTHGLLLCSSVMEDNKVYLSIQSKIFSVVLSDVSFLVNQLLRQIRILSNCCIDGICRLCIFSYSIQTVTQPLFQFYKRCTIIRSKV